ncbi:MAG: MBL fold metallo-hydrolase [Byssovorax sp.]
MLETHAHADHLSSSQLLKRRHGARVAIGARITEVQQTFKGVFDLPDDFPTDGSQFDRLLADGEKVEAGSLLIEVIATPGHTPACVTYKIGDAIFTGDAIFIEDYGTGRCDFPRGSAADLYRLDPRPALRAARQHAGLRRPRLPAERAAGCAPRPRSSPRRRTSSSGLDAGEEQFVRFRKERDSALAAKPRLLFQSVQVNTTPAACRRRCCERQALPPRALEPLPPRRRGGPALAGRPTR